MVWPPDIAVLARRRRREGGSTDKLGKGNTLLLTNLGVTPLAFYDVRKNLTLSGSNVTSLKDVKGDGTYGPSFGTGGTAPTWDGTVINTNGNGILLTSAVVPGLDLSTQLTVAIIADVAGTTANTAAVFIGAASAGTPFWETPFVTTGPLFRTRSSGNTTGVTSTAATGTGSIRLVLHTVNVSGTDVVTVEVPATAKATSSAGSALASGNQLIAIGGTTAAGSLAAVRFRALIAWTGGYTATQRDTLVTYAQTYHGEVNA